ncbi:MULTISPECIES: YggT family protein [Kocuria]|uniref:YggT family protein n=1 Tax=Kocuria TaxID=57493 RepID=UPI0007EB46BF|nr:MULTISPECIES: YggT family protein [Kocuria]MBN6811247.1 YggT family protein [Kocuria indica]MBN6842856.1 YggT family protein [Kocuria indica]MCG7432473.1 YggT family protein [Kocuria indica]MCT1723361.1 YggT family protein [Kocuria marina]MCT1734774.1 YggT family protein [Kocuria marina]
MGLVLSIVYLVVHVLYIALLGRLVLDWVQMFARGWRPKGMALVAASTIYSLTDPPMKALRRLVPPLRFGGVALDLGFLILVFAVSILQAVLAGFLLRG